MREPLNEVDATYDLPFRVWENNICIQESGLIIRRGVVHKDGIERSSLRRRCGSHVRKQKGFVPSRVRVSEHRSSYRSYPGIDERRGQDDATALHTDVVAVPADIRIEPAGYTGMALRDQGPFLLKLCPTQVWPEIVGDFSRIVPQALTMSPFVAVLQAANTCLEKAAGNVVVENRHGVMTRGCHLVLQLPCLTGHACLAIWTIRLDLSSLIWTSFQKVVAVRQCERLSYQASPRPRARLT